MMESYYKIISNPDKTDRKDWDDFILRHPEGNIFQSSEYYDAIVSTRMYKPVFISCIDTRNNKIRGLILGVIQKEFSGALGLITSRCIIVGGPIVSKDDIEKIYSLILSELQRKLKFKVIFTQFQLFVKPYPQIYDIYIKYGFYYEEYLNILVDTSQSRENLWKSVKRNRKDGINKGKKQGFQFSAINNHEVVVLFYNLLKSSYKKIKKPIPAIDHFYALQKNIYKDNLVFFQLKYNSRDVISLLCFNDKSRLYAYYIGIEDNEELLRLKPVDYLYWQVLLWCHENGIHYFDWMGAGIKGKPYGVRDFKLQYGGDLFENGRMSRFSNKIVGAALKLAMKLYWK